MTNRISIEELIYIFSEIEKEQGRITDVDQFVLIGSQHGWPWMEMVKAMHVVRIQLRHGHGRKTPTKSSKLAVKRAKFEARNQNSN